MYLFMCVTYFDLLCNCSVLLIMSAFNIAGGYELYRNAVCRACFFIIQSELIYNRIDDWCTIVFISVYYLFYTWLSARVLEQC